MQINSLNDFLSLSSLAGDLLQHYFLKKDKCAVVVWSLTNRCNFDCDYCGLPHLDHSKELSEQDLLDYLQLTIDQGLRVLSLTGGEPLIHPAIEKFVTLARSHGVQISLNSNGAYIPKKIEFIKKNFGQVIVSLDGPKDINDLHRGKGTFEKTMKGIEVLKERDLRYFVTSVLTQDSFHAFDDVVNFYIKEKIPVSFQMVFPKTISTFENYQNSLSAVDTLNLISRLMDYRKKHPNLIKNDEKSLSFLKDQLLTPKKLDCRAGELFMRIEPNGDIRKCGRVEEIISYQKVKELGLMNAFRELRKFDHCTTCTSQVAMKANFKKIY